MSPLTSSRYPKSMITPRTPEATWPVSVAGWIALFASLSALGVSVYQWGWRDRGNKAMLNGFGDRLANVERDQTASRERDSQWLISLGRLTAVNVALTKDVGRAIMAADACEQDMLEATHDIRTQINDLGKGLVAVETELRLMREKK